MNLEHLLSGLILLAVGGLWRTLVDTRDRVIRLEARVETLLEDRP